MYDSYKSPEEFKSRNGYIIDDVWYPRVTSIVSIKSKPALYMFYGGLDSYAQGEKIKKLSADQGTKVHEAAEKILVGEEPIPDPEIAPTISAFREFLDKTKIQVDKEWVEKRVVHFGERYAGTVDALALIGGKFGVLDIKTSQAIYRDYNLQTAAYFASLQDIHSNLQTRWILRVDQIQTCVKCGATMRSKGGREKIRRPKPENRIGKICIDENHEWGPMKGVIELGEFPYWHDDYQAFLGAKKLWEWENDYWLKKIGY